MTAVAELAVAQAVNDDYDFEPFNGRKEVKMAGGMHGRTIMRLGARLQIFVANNGLGDIYSPDTTFMIGTEERLPDLAFLSRERIPADGVPYGKWTIAPDLAIEVISPNDVWEKVNDKIHDYFAAGVKQVWLVALKHREVHIYDSAVQPRVLTENDELTNAALLPGFSCRVGELFS
jgi:Uma2 family endonuclease